MTTSNGLAVAEVRNGALAQLSEEKRDLLKRTIAKGATDDELELALTMAGTWGLDPFAKQIAFIKRWDSREKREVMSIQPTIDGARLLAQRSHRYGGQLGPWWCGTDGVWHEVWLEDKPPCAAKVGVINKEWEQPLFAVAKFSSYCAKKDGKPVALWATMPELMIAKCAEMLALRRAFPAEFREFYGDGDESAVSDSINYVNVVEAEGVVSDANTGEVVTVDEVQVQPTRSDANRRMHKLAADKGIDHELLRLVAADLFAVKSLTELSNDQMSDIAGRIERLTEEQVQGWIAFERAQKGADVQSASEAETRIVDAETGEIIEAEIIQDDSASPLPALLERIAKADSEGLRQIGAEIRAAGISDIRIGNALTDRNNELRAAAPQPELVSA